MSGYPRRGTKGETTISNLIAMLMVQETNHGETAQVRLIVNGIAYPVDSVWWEPGQEQVGAVCIGDDPR